MKVYIRILPVLALCSILALGFFACSGDDGYSLDKYWEDIVTVGRDGSNTTFVRNDGTSLFVISSETNSQPQSKRVAIRYVILSDGYNGYDHAIKLIGYKGNILTKDVIYVSPDDASGQKNLGNDPIKIISISEGGGYLNINLKFNCADISAHVFNMVALKPDLSVADDIVHLEFRHNANNDPQYRPVQSYISFDLAPYRTPNRDKVTFEITVKESEQQRTNYTIEYKYGGF